MKVREIILSGRDRLQQARLQCADPLLHMKQIVEFAQGWSTAELYLHWEDEIGEAGERQVEQVLARRLQGEPFQYITGFEWFWESRFQVGPGVLIPRCETELLVETLLVRVEGPRRRIAELGAGLGNIGISVLLERPDWDWQAFEINPDSVRYLRANQLLLLPSGSPYHIHTGDFFALAGAGAPYDALVSNPPYVAKEKLAELPVEVRHEPQLALDGGPEGKECLDRFFAEGAAWVKPGGWCLAEIGFDQGELALAIAREAGLEKVELLRDYAGLPRVIVGRRG